VTLSLGCSAASGGPPRLPICSDPSRLACTGLYGPEGGSRDKQIAAGVESYAPGFQLWSDGLEKARYVYLPPGSRIDTSDMDEWRFPVGTKFWKEFSWKERRIETRFLEKTAPDAWRRTTFVWNRDETDAREEVEGRTITLDAPHRPYDIPGQQDCGRCHGGRRDNVLGFEALALAGSGASGLTVKRLAVECRLTRPPDASAQAVPGSALDRIALGWLHMNCGVSCHNANPEAGASFAGLNLKLAANGPADPRQTAALRTTLNQRTTALGFRDPSAPKIRIVPGSPRQSAIYFRAGSRSPTLAMPPLATHVVDEESLAVLDRWIVALGGSREVPP